MKLALNDQAFVGLLYFVPGADQVGGIMLIQDRQIGADNIDRTFHDHVADAISFAEWPCIAGDGSGIVDSECRFNFEALVH